MAYGELLCKLADRMAHERYEGDKELADLLMEAWNAVHSYDQHEQNQLRLNDKVIDVLAKVGDTLTLLQQHITAIESKR